MKLGHLPTGSSVRFHTSPLCSATTRCPGPTCMFLPFVLQGPRLLHQDIQVHCDRRVKPLYSRNGASCFNHLLYSVGWVVTGHANETSAVTVKQTMGCKVSYSTSSVNPAWQSADSLLCIKIPPGGLVSYAADIFRGNK